MPIALYIFRYLPSTISISTAPDMILKIDVGLPFNWMILWLSSFLFALSAALFAIFCPSFIKRHDTYTKYKELGHSPRWVIWEVYYALSKKGKFPLLWKYDHTQPMRKRFIDKGLATCCTEVSNKVPEGQNAAVEALSDRTIVYFMHQSQVYEMYSRQAPEADDQRENDIFWELFGYLTKRHPLVRGAINCLIIISFALVFWVFIENVWFTIEYFVEWLDETTSIMQV
ncbi:MAG: hypothetical protein RID07_07040 [Lacipirellulaceae bacterium]